MAETERLLANTGSVYGSLRGQPVLDESVVREHDPLEGAAVRVGDEGTGEDYDDVPKEKRQIGFASAVFLITNRIIGTGIFATPSIILSSGGSVGMALVLWLLGALVASAGTAVYLELGTGLPRSGGEKVYLEYIYRRPKYLILCVYATWAILTGWAAANCVVFGEYLLRTLDVQPTATNTRVIGVLCLTIATIIHSTAVKYGLRAQNVLGAVGVITLLFVAFSGLLALSGLVPLADGRTLPRNFDHVWEGTRWDANAFVTGLFTVSWSYIGYSNANYALTEIKDPIRTIKRAAPTALLSITLLYFLVNIAYFAVVDKEEIVGGGRIVTALFFRNLYGEHTERVLSFLIALSTLGNVLAVTFAASRVVQELAREGILPLSPFLSTNKPFNTPFGGLFEQWILGVISITVPPPGDAYLFMLNLSSYPLAISNALISFGLLTLYYPSLIPFSSFFSSRSKSPNRTQEWLPPFKAYKPVIAFFFLSNLFLLAIPLVPPKEGQGPYQRLPYWSHPVTVLGISFLGGIYWWSVFKVLPRRGGYVLDRVHVRGEDGFLRVVFEKKEGVVAD